MDATPVPPLPARPANPAAAETLRKAKEMLSMRHRWMKSELAAKVVSYDDENNDTTRVVKPVADGPHCVLGAIAIAGGYFTDEEMVLASDRGDAGRIYRDLTRRPEVRLLEECIVDYLTEDSDTEIEEDFEAAQRVYFFNDNSATQHEDVLEALDCAIALAEGKPAERCC